MFIPQWSHIYDGNCLQGVLVEELLIDDVSPGTLDDISTMLEPWLTQKSVHQRAAAVYILKTTLQAYHQHMTFGYEVSHHFCSRQEYLWGYIFQNLMKANAPVTIAVVRLI